MIAEGPDAGAEGRVLSSAAGLATPPGTSPGHASPSPLAAESTARERYFCYMLTSAVCGATYIGASTDPWRRLRQHNGELCGGARATRQNRPWRLHTVVGGFVEWRDALRFEWAWKHRPCRRRVARGVHERAQRSIDLLRAQPHLTLERVRDSAFVHHRENDDQQ
jgi:structure-specific endonuclease subunit SLX1